MDNYEKDGVLCTPKKTVVSGVIDAEALCCIMRDYYDTNDLYFDSAHIDDKGHIVFVRSITDAS